MPYFTIIIPSFNRVHVIDRAIQSILNQTYPDWELIIVDDGSTDNTKEILTPILADKRIKYIYQDNAGVCAARNNGALKATGEHLVFLDSDDSVLETWLEDFYTLKEYKHDIIFCNMKIIKPDKTIKLVSCLDPYNDGNSKGISIPGTWSIRKDIFIASGMYDEKIKYGENTELRFRFNEEILKIGLIDKYNFIYNESLIGGSKNLKNKIDSNIYILSKHPNYFKKYPHALRFYYQNIAVAYSKLGMFNCARKYFWLAYKVNIMKIDTFIRLVISFFPMLGKKIWK